MKKKKPPKSVRRHIRNEKARIRREVLDPEEQKRLIKELLDKYKFNSGPQKESR